MNKENACHPSMLQELTTSQLDILLAQELQKEVPDEENVRDILTILKDREKDHLVEITPGIHQAWSKYQEDCNTIYECRPTPRRTATQLVRAASVIIVLFLLVAALPQNAHADNLWHRIVRWTGEIFEFFSPHTELSSQLHYVFKTNHPGLQQIYDTVIEMGISETVVPMWLPEEYELKENIVYKNLDCEFILATLSDGTKEVVLEIKKFDSLIPGHYEKDDTEIKVIEIEGIKHYITRNNNRWNLIWTQNNIECCLSIDCQEDLLYDVLKSIYGMEEYI